MLFTLKVPMIIHSVEHTKQGQGHSKLSSRSLEAKDTSSKTPSEEIDREERLQNHVILCVVEWDQSLNSAVADRLLASSPAAAEVLGEKLTMGLEASRLEQDSEKRCRTS